MKTAAIIAEYNPLHNGHIYQFECLRNEYTHIVALMSASFVQRGGPSVYSKQERTLAALKSGADLILQLPYVYSAQTAEVFAGGACRIIDKISPDALCFGCEDADVNAFTTAAKILAEEPPKFKKILTEMLSEGESFAVSRLAALSACVDTDCSFLKKPNNILALEYIKSLLTLKSGIKPLLLKRAEGGNIKTATEIRNMIYANQDASGYMPVFSLPQTHSIEDYRDIIKAKLILTDAAQIDKIAETETGMGARMKKCINNLSEGCEAFIDAVCTKRYTKSRIRRVVINMLMNYGKEDMAFFKRLTPEYVRVLGFNDKGRELLNGINDLTVVTNVSKSLKTISVTDRRLLDFDTKAEALYHMHDKELFDDTHSAPVIIR